MDFAVAHEVPPIRYAVTEREEDRRSLATSREVENRWLAKNRAAFAGQWVALSGDRLLASGLNASEVYAKPRALGVDVPFVAHLNADDDLPFAGWWRGCTHSPSGIVVPIEFAGVGNRASLDAKIDRAGSILSARY